MDRWRVFETAMERNAVIMLDESDVFIAKSYASQWTSTWEMKGLM
jgi:hypothetical protein